MRNRTLLTFLMVSVMLLTSCSTGPAQPSQPQATEVPAEPAGPVTLRVGWAGSPDTINPGMATLVEAYTLFEIVYDSMFILNLDGTYSPELAETYEVSDEGKVWTFKIRQDVKWHDGQPLTAKDVAFSYNYYASHEDFPYLPVYTTYFESVEAPDNSTVIIRLTEAIPNMESQLIFMYVLPEHIWKDHDADAAEFENTEMIGSGPFKMQEYRQGEFVHLVTNREYWGVQPKIDEVVFQTFDNPDALVQALKTDQLDMITELPNTAIASLKSAENVEVVSGAPLAPYVNDVIFNQVAPENCPPDDGVCSGHPALRDRNLRLALAHATDKKKIIDVVMLGMGDPGLTLIPIGLGEFYNSSLKDYEYDVAKAKQILEDAGYKDSDGDGVRESPEGQPLVFRMNWPNDSLTAPREAELLNEMWSEVGVKLELQTLDPDTLTSICCPAFDFDVMLWGWASDPDPGYLLSVMLTDEIPTGNSETGYSNPTYDELYTQQATELDFAKRKATIWEMQKLVFDDVVYIIPFYDVNIQAYRSDRFTGWLTNEPKLALEDISSLQVIQPIR